MKLHTVISRTKTETAYPPGYAVFCTYSTSSGVIGFLSSARQAQTM